MKLLHTKVAPAVRSARHGRGESRVPLGTERMSAQGIGVDDLGSVLRAMGTQRYPGVTGLPGLATLARAIGRPRLIQALDHPGPLRLGAVRLLLAHAAPDETPGLR